ncbi:MAG TPA: D-alanyl-D-alanine carboxypeptidase [Streptosporangiaceae bacterium]|jgi:D-alanyl-D-alanine carboxypeptidase (penicillin-binding protein 5/6)|nr:D-alanyl-D-alanine carboxypeptidase [Streptosporangiaceae bacterium]
MPYSTRLTALAAAAGILCAGLAGCAAPDGSPRAAASNSAAVTGSPSATPTPPGMQKVQTASSPRRVAATGGALADAGTKRLLWSRKLTTERPIGSITKVMTALLVIESGGLNRKIRIPKAVIAYVAKYQGESAGLHPGDVVTARDLLEALLLQSGCDAAYVLATTYGPGMPAFLAKMNAKAAQLGMTHTHFTSPDGLPYPSEYSTYSTPADLLTLGMAAMKLPVFRAIVGQRFYHIARRKGHHHAYWWDNTNGLIGTYRGADGIKTGYTDAAKHCLLFEAVRHGKTLIGDVLGSPTTGPDAAAQAAARLMNWGFGLNSSA